MENFRNPCGQFVTVHGLLWVPNLCNYVLMYVLVCMRLKMAVKFEFTK